MLAFVELFFWIVAFCIFVGIFIRLGKIENILQRMAIKQGAIELDTTPKEDHEGQTYNPYKRKWESKKI
jgi:hypothetical protein